LTETHARVNRHCGVTTRVYVFPRIVLAAGDEEESSAMGEGAMESCPHASLAREVRPSGQGCKECLEIGTPWVHLRLCMICGHVGCCDNSPGRHATGHFVRTGHPLIKSFEPGEDWWWCYVDETMIEPPLPPRPEWTRRL
jgi:uncharacterized UBP type Zn finger protein